MRSLIYYGNPILRQKAKRVEALDDYIRQLVEEMKGTVLETRAVGLAAPQLGESLALFITRVLPLPRMQKGEIPPFRIYINPKILSYSSDATLHNEGCLSIPTIRAEVSRPISIEVEATNLEGERFVESLSGLEARVVMHENDHINGTLFIDRLKGDARKAIEPLLRALKKNS